MRFNIYKIFLFSLVLGVVVSLPRSSFCAEKPGEIVVEKIRSSLLILRDPALQSQDKYNERREKLWDLLGPTFHFEEIARRSLGPHWNTLTLEERREFTETFTNVLKDLYLGKSDAYTGEQIIYLREQSSGDRSKVQTDFVTKDNKKVSVDFSMKKDAQGWRVYDLVIEGVSIVGNYRTQFNSILSKSSFKELLKKLKKKELKGVEI